MKQVVIMAAMMALSACSTEAQNEGMVLIEGIYRYWYFYHKWGENRGDRDFTQLLQIERSSEIERMRNCNRLYLKTT